MDNLLMWLVLFSTSGVIAEFIRNYKLGRRLTHLQEQHNIHNSLLEKYSKEIGTVIYEKYTSLAHRIVVLENTLKDMEANKEGL